MKKIISLLLGIVLILSIVLLSACGEKRAATDMYTSTEKSAEGEITEQTEPEHETDSPSNPRN